MNAKPWPEEQVLDIVTKALLKGAKSLGELAAEFDFDIRSDQLDEALDILDESGALNERQEPRHGSLIPIYEIKRDQRTDTAVREYRALLRS